MNDDSRSRRGDYCALPRHNGLSPFYSCFLYRLFFGMDRLLK